MSRRLTTTSASPRAVVTGTALVAVAVVVMLLLRLAPSPEPFDPRSAAGTGARGLVALLESQGATVELTRTVPAVGSRTRVLVLKDDLDPAQRRELEAFVRAGGVAVVADPASSLAGALDVVATVEGGTPTRRSLESEIVIERGTCDVDSLAALRGVFVQDGVRMSAAGAASSCFASSDSGAFLVVRRLGVGYVVRLGDNDLFTNRQLDLADNSGLAAALLAPTSGSRAAIIDGRGRGVDDGAVVPGDVDEATGGATEGSLSDLVDTSVWMVLAQVAIAVVLFGVARSIRVGRPVSEPEEITVDGSELVVATGRLMERAHHSSAAAVVLQREAHRRMCESLHLDVGSPIEELDAVMTLRGSTAPGEVAEVLHRDAPTDTALDRVHHDLLRLRRLAELESSVGAADDASAHRERFDGTTGMEGRRS